MARNGNSVPTVGTSVGRSNGNGNGGARGGRKRFANSRAMARKAGRQALYFSKDLWFCALTFFNSTTAIIALVLVIALAITHSADRAEGAIHDWAKNYPANALFQWFSVYIEKMVGLLAFVPVVILMPSRSMPMITSFIVGLVIVMLPAANFYQYVIIAAFTHVFVQCRLATTRMLVIFAGVIYVFFVHAHIGNVTHPSSLFNEVVSKGLPVPLPPNRQSSGSSTSGGENNNNNARAPNYMAATESSAAKANGG